MVRAPARRSAVIGTTILGLLVVGLGLRWTAGLASEPTERPYVAFADFMTGFLLALLVTLILVAIQLRRHRHGFLVNRPHRGYEGAR